MLYLKDDTDIVGLAKAVVSSSGCTSAKEPYWENSAADLFSAFVRLAQLLHKDWARMDDVLRSIRIMDFVRADQDDDDEDDNDCGIPFDQLPPIEQFYKLREKDPQMFMSWYQYYRNADWRQCLHHHPGQH